jgi:hypothetical protein
MYFSWTWMYDMAFFNDLVKAVAAAEGLDVMTVRNIGLRVREAGFIQLNGRGTSAAVMTETDASALLIGVNVPGLAKDAGTAVAEFYRLETDEVPQPPGKHPNNAFVELCGPEKRFGDALAGLVGAFIPSADGTLPAGEILQPYLSDGMSPTVEGIFRSAIMFEIIFRRPGASAEIKIEQHPVGRFEQPWHISGVARGFFYRHDGKHPEPRSGDRVEEIRITARTLAAVGQALAA